MANFVLQFPTTLKNFTVFASANTNGGVSGGSGSSSGGVGGPVILELPLDKIRRPLMRTRSNDQNKVEELMDSISQIGLQVPVFLGVTAMRLTSDLDSPPYAAKYAVVLKRL